jgi:hypothetical protein
MNVRLLGGYNEMGMTKPVGRLIVYNRKQTEYRVFYLV